MGPKNATETVALGAELQELMLSSVRQASSTTPTGPVCRWDQIHDMIVQHSPDAALVIVNLPDPPELIGASLTAAEHLSELVQYMEYMEGLASDLPRALYVHGSGQEIINLDQIE